MITFRHKTSTGFVVPIFPQLRQLMEKFRQGKIIVLRPVSYEAMPGEQERAETSAAGPAGVNVMKIHPTKNEWHR